jgi:hypothetical protein
MAITLRTVAASYLNPSTGVGLLGSVTFSLSAAMSDASSGAIYPEVSLTAQLDASGSMSIVLAANDDSTTLPQGTVWEVQELIAGCPVRRYSVSIPSAGTGNVELASLAPTISNPVYAYVLATAVGAADGVASLDAGGQVPAGELGNAAGLAPVQSVFGRSGAVVAAAGDYTAADVGADPAGAAAAAQAAAEAASLPLTGGTLTGALVAPDVSVSGLTGATAPSRYVGGTTLGAPSSGTFAVGDFVIDQSGAVWICTFAGTPGTWTRSTSGGVPWQFVPAVVGAWYPNPMGRTISFWGPNQDLLQLWPFHSGPSGVTIDLLDTAVHVAWPTGSIMRAGLYQVLDQSDPFAWTAGTAWATLLVDAGTVGIDAVGVQQWTLATPQAIPPSTWFAVGGVVQSAGSGQLAVANDGGGSIPSPWGGSGQNPGAYQDNYRIAIGATGVSGALPATFVPSTGGLPGIVNDNGVGIHRSA